MTPRNKKRVPFIITNIVLTFAAIYLILTILPPFPLPLSLVNKNAFKQVRAEYNGRGSLIALMDSGDNVPAGPAVVREAPFQSSILKSGRALIIYLPPGYGSEKARRYPVMYAFHGFASRPQFWVKNLLPALEDAIVRGDVPPLIVVMPDGSLSGNGRDDSATPYDDRGGSWYINSNRGRFEDHFFNEIVPYVEKRFSVLRGPRHTALIGTSMGGFAALRYGIARPAFAHIIIPLYATSDLRYSVDGSRTAAYRADGYQPITSDMPSRIANASLLGGIAGITDEWLYYPVFDSDTAPGPVWRENRPVWERMFDVNPVDTLRNGGVTLAGQRYYMLAGIRDDFNFNAHFPVILPLLRDAGAKVYPDNPIVLKGRHNWETTVAPRLNDLLLWLGNELKK